MGYCFGIVLIFDTDVLTNGTASGFGYYTYTGSTTLTGVNTSLDTQAVQHLASFTTVSATAISQK